MSDLDKRDWLQTPTWFRNELGQYRLNIGRLRMTPWTDWAFLWDSFRYNWVNIELVRFQVELGAYKTTLELTIALLGFNLCVEWYYGDNP